MFGSTNTKLWGSGPSYGYIMAEYPEGSQCQVTRELDDTVLKAKDTGGNWAFALPEVIGLKIPKEYQEVKWIESTGTQYIITGIAPSEVRGGAFSFVKTADVGYSFLWGAGSNSSNVENALGFRISTGGQQPPGLYYGNVSNFLQANVNIGTSYTVEFTCSSSSQSLHINDISSASSYSLTPTGDFPITLFTFNYATTVKSSEICKAQLKHIEFYDVNSTKILDMYPCYRKADSVAGMYDIVSRTFFTNAGTGTFTVGPDAGGDKWTAYCTDGENEAEKKVNILYNGDIKSIKLYYRVPKEYQAIEYLQNSYNAYYDTGIIPITTNYTTEVKFQIAITNGGYLLGVEGGYFIRKPNGYDQIYYGYDNNSTYFSVNGISTVGTDFDLIYNATGGQILLNGDVKATNANIKALSNRQYSILIGACRYGANVQDFGVWRYKEVIISERDTGNKLAELFPCYRKSDNVVGFWDTVGQKFLTHLGTGTVTAGPDI